MITGVEQEIKVGTNCYKASWTTAELAANSNYVATGYPVSNTYLASTAARASLKALTIADSTFLLNTGISIGLGSSKSPTLANEALLFIKQGDYEKKYGFSLDVTRSNASGVSASITFSSAFNVVSYQRRAYISGLTLDANNAGSGFAVNDIVDIPLVTNKTIHHLWSGTGLETLDFRLWLFTQPTMRVTQIGPNGSITGASIENAGSFAYAGSNYSYSTKHGLGVTTSSGPYYSAGGGNIDEVISIPTTNNTAVTGNNNTSNKVTLKKVFQSGSSASNNSSSTASSNILEGVNALTNSSGDHAGTTTGTDGLSTYFETTGSAESNLLVLSPRQNSSGEELVEKFSITPIDGMSGEGMGVVYKEVNSISDLPLVAKNGFEVKVAGDVELNQDDYYVRFETTSGETIGQGSWIECVAPELLLGYDANTLPMELISDGSGFTLRTMKVADRIAGDVNSNPLASFVTQTIDNLFFFKNRLGFLCGENVVMSESGLGALDTTGQLNFNFGRTTVTTLLDSDPIDVSVASSRVTNLKAAKGFQENLILFSESGQFVLKGGDVLTPKSVSITPITNFSFEDQVDPLPLGSYIYFPFTRGAFTGIREFTVNASTDNYDSTEVTEHVPAYIPKNIIDTAGTTSEDMIVLLSGDEKGSLYCYNYFWSNNQKVLSAWSKFTFTGEIRGIEFIESTLYMVMTDDESNTHLVSLPMEAGLQDVGHTGASSDFLTLLDRRVRVKVEAGTSNIKFEQADGTYSSQVPYTYYNGTIPTAGQPISEVFVDSTATTHSLLCFDAGDGAQPLLEAGNASIDLYGYVGVPYTMKYKFSTQVFKASAGKSSSPTNASAMHVRNGTMFFDDTHTFDVKVTPENRTTATSTFLADDVPEAEEIIVEEYPLAVGTSTYSRGTVWTNTSASAFTIVVSDTNVGNASGGATNYDYPYVATRPATVGKYRMTFDLELITGSLDAIDIIWSDADNIPSNGITYAGYVEPTVGSNVIEMDIFDDGLTGGNEPPPQIMWRVMTDSLLNVSITNFKLCRLSPVKFAEGNFRFPVYSKAKHANILIQNDSPFDSKFSSAEFESFVHPRSSRYG
jgi:hypothetical protein